ncbi:MAG: hypothetical protein ACREDT_05190 [Methylocella sp.]
MDTNVPASLGQIAGVAGIVSGIVMIIYRDVIQKRLLARLSQSQSFQVLIILVVLAWGMGIVGISAWRGTESSGKCNPNINKNSGSIVQNFKC